MVPYVRTIYLPTDASLLRPVPGGQLYDVWTNPNGEDLYTFTIITKDANRFTAQLHNRMPVILDRELERAWLDPEITSAADEVIR